MRTRTTPFITIPRISPAALSILLFLALNSCTSRDSYQDLIAKGEFSRAQALIEERLQSDASLSDEERWELPFEIERMARIRKDFRQTEAEVMEYIRAVIPDVSEEQQRQWEASKALEYMYIDGEKLYFNRAGRNLFRIDHESRELWNTKYSGEQATTGTGVAISLDQHNLEVIETALRTGKRFVKPVRLRVRQSVRIPEGMVPAGETLRCWIPFPREIEGRQEAIRLLHTTPDKHLVAENDKNLQRTIYFEKETREGEPSHFEVEYEYTSFGCYVPVEAAKVVPAKVTAELAPFVAEVPPHIVFTKELRELSEEIVGEETNPYLVARRLFEWVDSNIPWASAREYSTIRNLSSYAYENMHGDCGIQTFLFMTLCRINGIPTRWQSGWEYEPPDDSMHDWGMIYFEPYGWVPMDVTYGLPDSGDDRLKWFYLHGMDSYRLIFNDAYSQPFHPEKEHFRSETVDSQRGEVEWRGGNLYFDQWEWGFEWEVLE